MGDYTHELFRADMAAMRNPYFSECWQLAKQEFDYQLCRTVMRHWDNLSEELHIVGRQALTNALHYDLGNKKNGMTIIEVSVISDSKESISALILLPSSVRASLKDEIAAV